MKRCCQCARELPPSEFHRRAAALDGLQPRCKECCRIRNAADQRTRRARARARRRPGPEELAKARARTRERDAAEIAGVDRRTVRRVISGAPVRSAAIRRAVLSALAWWDRTNGPK